MCYYVYKGKNEYVCGIPFIKGGIYEVYLEERYLSSIISAKIINPLNHFQIAKIPYSSKSVFDSIWECVTLSNHNIETRKYGTRI